MYKIWAVDWDLRFSILKGELSTPKPLMKRKPESLSLSLLKPPSKVVCKVSPFVGELMKHS